MGNEPVWTLSRASKSSVLIERRHPWGVQLGGLGWALVREQGRPGTRPAMQEVQRGVSCVLSLFANRVLRVFVSITLTVKRLCVRTRGPL